MQIQLSTNFKFSFLRLLGTNVFKINFFIQNMKRFLKGRFRNILKQFFPED